MFKTSFVSILLAPTILFGATNTTQFQCTALVGGVSRALTVQFNFNESDLGGKLMTRAQVKYAGTKGEEKYCAVFDVVKNYKRIGYVQTFSGMLPNGAFVSIKEDSYTNEGPAKFSGGVLYLNYKTAGEVSAPLACVKS